MPFKPCLQAAGCSETELGDLVAGRQQVSGTKSGVMDRLAFKATLRVRRGMWSGSTSLSGGYPNLRKPASQVLSMHATTCAPERKWSILGNLYRKNRSLLAGGYYQS